MTWDIKKFLTETAAKETNEAAPADQVKGTEKAKKAKPAKGGVDTEHPFAGRLVGGESVDAEELLKEFQEFIEESPEQAVAEGLPTGDEYTQRRKLIKYIARQKNWDASDLEHATTQELIQWYKESQKDRKDWNNRRSDWWSRADALAKEKGISQLDALGQTPHDLDRDSKQIQLKFKEQAVEEEASPMIKPPQNRFDSKSEAFAYKKQHGGKVFKHTYIDPNTGMKNITYSVKPESAVVEAKPVARTIPYDVWNQKFGDEQRSLKSQYPDLKITGAPKAKPQRSVVSPRKSSLNTLDLAAIARKIENLVGQSFPDGDPIDYIIPYLDRLGVPSNKTFEVIDRAIKKHTHRGGYYKWLEDMWNDVADDELLPDHVTRANNPWKAQNEQVEQGVAEELDTPDIKNPIDKVTMDIPLLLRVLEYSKEDAKTDMDLHTVTQNLINLSKGGKTLNMSDYETIVRSAEPKSNNDIEL